MMCLIIGGAASGKSALGERYVSKLGKPLLYIATMEPYGEDGAARVNRHREQREAYGFHTLECYRNLDAVKLEHTDTAALLECVGNLAANEMFREGAHSAVEETVSKVMCGINSMRRQTRHLFLISNDVFGQEQKYTPQTSCYIQALGEVNQKLAELADTVVEAVCGLPVLLKGGDLLP